MSPLVLWDIDNTLVNADGLGTRLYREVFRELYGRELSAVAPKAGRTDRAITLDTLTLAGVPDPRAAVDPFLAALARHVAALPGEGSVLALPGAAQALRTLARQDGQIRQSVLTGNIRILAELKLRRAGLDKHLDFDTGAYGDAHEVRANLVDIARRAARLTWQEDFAGKATVLVGDTPLDVEAALATGARAVAVASGSYSYAALADAGAHAVLPDLTDTARLLSAVLGAGGCRVPAR